MKDHDGSVALITGGSSGIGRAVAELLASPRASFITGEDIRVDGGLLATLAAAVPRERDATGGDA